MTGMSLSDTVNGAAFDFGYLKVSSLHSLYYEQHGRRDGKTVIVLHGGPGDRATVPESLTSFNLSVFRVILFDQRGSGKSLPSGELRENTSVSLVQDIETIRLHLSIRKWYIVFGGSWGSTLALLYAQAYPSSISSLVLRGVFLFTEGELAWLYGNDHTGHSLATMFPDTTDRFIQHLINMHEDPTDPISGYHRLITHADESISLPAAREWARQELTISKLEPSLEEIDTLLDDEVWLSSFAGIEVTYIKNRAWLEPDQILQKENLDRIRHIPTVIVQGRYDVICPPRAAWRLYLALRNGEEEKEKSVVHPDQRIHKVMCELFWTMAGHAPTEPETLKKLIEVCGKFAAMELS